MQNNYTPEQIEDIKSREAKCLAFLKENEMAIAALVGKVRLDNPEGKDLFVDSVQPYLSDTKFTQKSVISPLSDEMTKKDDSSETT